MKTILAIALCLLAIPCRAEIIPPQGGYDPRVRQVDYNPMNVVRLSTYYGVSTHVQFADDETVADVSIGDEGAWTIEKHGNHLFIKPKADKADTNLTIVTDKRTYQFALVVHARPLKDAAAWADPNLIFSLSFRYPADEAMKKQVVASIVQQQTAAAENKREIKQRLNAATTANNYDYWVAGSEEIAPTAARDDGRFIFLTFGANRDMPAVYAVDGQGREALINTNVIDGNTIVVQRMVPRLILRKGAAVASVINKSFDLNGGHDNTTGTVAPDVVRIIKGGE